MNESVYGKMEPDIFNKLQEGTVLGPMAAVISLIFGAIELVVGLRFIFLIVGANPNSQFVTWIYDISSMLVAPFAGILGHATAVPSGFVAPSIFDPAALVALVVYGAVGGVLMAIFGLGRRPV